MIERCNHGDVAWDRISENTTAAHGKAVGTCRECGARVASTLTALHEVEQPEGEDLESRAVLESGHA